MMKKVLLQSLFVVLSVLNLGVIGYSLMIYSSCFEWVPWYDPCGMQFLAIPFHSLPAFAVLGVCLWVLGKFMKISLLHKLLPFLALGVFGIPAFVLPDTTPWLLIESILGVAVGLAAIASTVGNWVAMNRARQSA